MSGRSDAAQPLQEEVAPTCRAPAAHGDAISEVSTRWKPPFHLFTQPYAPCKARACQAEARPCPPLHSSCLRFEWAARRPRVLQRHCEEGFSCLLTLRTAKRARRFQRSVEDTFCKHHMAGRWLLNKRRCFCVELAPGAMTRRRFRNCSRPLLAPYLRTRKDNDADVLVGKRRLAARQLRANSPPPNQCGHPAGAAHSAAEPSPRFAQTA